MYQKLKVTTALNNSYINEYIRLNCEEMIVQLKDLQYQDAVLEMLETIKQDVLIISELLPGQYTKQDFIEKIRIINEDIKIFIILEKEDKDFRKLLISNNIFNIFLNEEITVDQLLKEIKDDRAVIKEKSEHTKLLEKKVKDLENILKIKPETKEKKEIIAIAGASSVGKTDIVAQLATILAQQTISQILIFDIDTFQGSIDQYFDINESPENIEFLIDIDKKTCLNYMVDAINRNKLNINTFKNYIIQDKKHKNLHILTGNNSLYECKENINTKHYQEIINIAKDEYQYIFLDTSSNIFIDSTRFAITNATTIFFIIEGTYINIKRSLDILDIYTNVWEIKQSTIKIIVNKYSSEYLEKGVIEELMGGYEIISYIPYNSKHITYLNKKIPMMDNCINKDKEPYIKITNQLGYIKKEKPWENLVIKVNKMIKGEK